jgi:hypothetical protein
MRNRTYAYIGTRSPDADSVISKARVRLDELLATRKAGRLEIPGSE